jgi:ribosome-associated translation inhibitor RaiA
MQLPVDITFLGMPPSPSVDAAIRRAIVRLERFCDRVVGCAVTVTYHEQAAPFHVSITMTVPGREIVVTNDPPYDNVYAAVSEAFRAARRQLQDYVRIRRHEVKAHAS